MIFFFSFKEMTSMYPAFSQLKLGSWAFFSILLKVYNAQNSELEN